MTSVYIPKAKFNANAEQKSRILENLPAAWMKVQGVPAPLTTPDGTPRRRRAGAYLRFSTDNQDIYSFARQKKNVEEYAEKLGVDIVEVFGDPASSGAFTANRPAYKAMMKTARKKKFDLLIIEDGDRLARKLHITTKAYSQLADVGVELHSTRMGKWSLLHAAFAGMMSEEQRRRIAELMQSGLVKIVNKGLWPTLAPLGYEKIPGKPGDMRVVERFASSVRRLFQLRAAGLGYYQIADIAEREKLPSTLSKWTGSQVRQMLFNPIYAGVICYFRTKTEKIEIDDDTIETKITKRAAEDWLYSERPDWRIVSPELWRAVRAMDADAPSVGPRSVYLLSRRVYCADCGQRMYVGGGKSTIPMLRCSTVLKIKTHRQRLAPCSGRAVRLEQLEDEVIRSVCAKLDTPEALKEMQQAHEARVKRESGVFDLDRARLQREKKALHERLDATYDTAMAAGLSSTVLVQQREEYCLRIDAIEEQIASIPVLSLETNALFATPIDASVFLDELVPGRNYRECSETVAQTVATFQKLVEKIVVGTDAAGQIHLDVSGPIAHIGGDAATALSLSYTPVTRFNWDVRLANNASRSGCYDIPGDDWAKMSASLPQEPIWIASADEAIPIKRVIEAVIAANKSGVGLANLRGAFDNWRQIWAAARILSYGGILDIAERLFKQHAVEVAKGVDNLSVDATRSPLNLSEEQAIERHRVWNERRRLQAARRLNGEDDDVN